MLVQKILSVILLVLQTIGKVTNDGCNCGIRDESAFAVRISGGEEAGVNEFPWAVLLKIKIGRRVDRCGGTLINDRFVLTAAHCVPKSTGIDVDVILGEHSIRNKSETNELRLKAEPPYLVHDKYEDKKSYIIYDFTLLRLSQRVNFDLYPHIRPICLPAGSFQEYQGEVAIVAGWGATEVDYAVSGNLIHGIASVAADTLQKLDIRLYEQSQCEDAFQPLDIKIKQANMCAVSDLGDSCGGDSGGGLMKRSSRGGYYEIVGVVSYGIGCRSTFEGKSLPGVYARVSSAVGWIERMTSSGRSCRKPTETQILTKPATAEKPALQSTSGWGEWTSFGECDQPCGIGRKSRNRFCEGSSCSHSQQTQDRPCRLRKC